MSGFKVNFSVNNQLSTPSIHAAPFAQRPAAGQPGRVFIDSDNPSTGIYRDTGTTWVAIGNPSTPDVDTLQIVTGRGNTTTNSITVGAATSPVGTIDVRRTTAVLNGANDWALVSNNNPTIASGASFGVNYVNAVYGSQALTFSGNATIGNTGINAAGNFINSLGNNASGTITVAQGSGTIRAIAGVQAGIYYNTPNAMTFTHVAGIKTLQPINSGAVGASVTNYYGVQIADSTPSSGTISYTNRYGIYQEGASDVNYFAGQVGMGTTTPTAIYKLHVLQSANQAIFEGATQGQIRIQQTGTTGIDLASPGNAQLGFYSGSAGSYRMYLFSNGNFGIGVGTTDAGYKLDVNGTARVSGNVGFGGANPDASYKLTVGGIFQFSTGSSFFGNSAGNLTLNNWGAYINNQSTSFSFIGQIAGTNTGSFTGSSTAVSLNAITNIPLRFLTNNAEVGRFTENGILAVGTSSPNASALLDVSSTTKGFLPPRMTDAQITAITTPANGLLVYSTTQNCPAFYDGTGWRKVSHSAL